MAHQPCECSQLAPNLRLLAHHVLGLVEGQRALELSEEEERLRILRSKVWERIFGRRH